jgi:predicted GNAT superfamily acetyltransferase
MTVEIRPVAGYAEYMACEEIQRVTWGGFGIVPLHMLLTAHISGGVLLGAFDTGAPGAPMVGFVFGFLGRAADGRLKHCSHMAAVLPGYRDARIGERLKLAQREAVLAQGIELMTWTYDPLISRNARLNIRKLGALCRTYKPNIYGPDPVPDDDLPSDRFQVEWWLGSPRVVARLAGDDRPPLAAEILAGAALLNPDPERPAAPLAGERLALRIPADIDALRAANLPRARAWSQQLRELATAAFAAGYHVAEYAREGESGYYLFVLGSGGETA